jgi:hypothetical protein
MPYERIVQWTAGPVAAISGWLATQLITNVKLFGTLGLGRDQLAHAILAGLTFSVTALVTYAAHQKWLTNLVKWWEASGVAQPSGAAPGTPQSGPVVTVNGHAPAAPGQLSNVVNGD